MSKINNVTQITLGVKSISIYKYAQDKHGNFMFSDDEVVIHQYAYQLTQKQVQALGNIIMEYLEKGDII